MIENRRVMLNVVPALFDKHHGAPVGDYPVRLLETLIDVRPAGVKDSHICFSQRCAGGARWLPT